MLINARELATEVLRKILNDMAVLGSSEANFASIARWSSLISYDSAFYR